MSVLQLLARNNNAKESPENADAANPRSAETPQFHNPTPMNKTPTGRTLVTPEDILRADPRLRVKTLAATERPNQVCWLAMHQDYFEGSVIDATPPPENGAGITVVHHLLDGGRGHFGPLEHPQITIAVAGFPHCVMQQARTHRVGISFDVQSMRYTGKRMLNLWDESEAYTPDKLDISDLVYFRTAGVYADREGGRYEYTEADIEQDRECAIFTVEHYNVRTLQGLSEEHARSILPFDFRQNFVVSFNIRSLMHFLDLRAKLDAQIEIQALCDLLMVEFTKWSPEISGWYSAYRWGKARLAP
jgi:thymidylate synthase (FAD)